MQGYRQPSSRTEGGDPAADFLPLFHTTSCLFCRRKLAIRPLVATECDFAHASRAHVPHVEVNHVLRIGPLDRDGKGLERVEGEGNQASYCVVYWPPQQAGLNFKLQKAGVACIKPVRDRKKRRPKTGQSECCMFIYT